MLDANKVRLAIAPIAWTNDDLPDLGAENTFEQCISEMALSGFTGSEIGNKYPKDVETLKQKLAIRGLQICNAWFSSTLLSEGYDATIKAFIEHRDFLHALGAKVIGASEQGNSIQGKPVSIFGDKPVYSEEEWALVARGFNEMGRLAREKDMIFTVHHHMGTGVQTEEEIDRLMELTDPNLVYLLYDTGHLAFSGEDALRVLRKYASAQARAPQERAQRRGGKGKSRGATPSSTRCAQARSRCRATAISTSSRCSTSSRRMDTRAGWSWRPSRTRQRRTRLNTP